MQISRALAGSTTFDLVDDQSQRDQEHQITPPFDFYRRVGLEIFKVNERRLEPSAKPTTKGHIVEELTFYVPWAI